jgi:hypothetical protein
MNKEKLIKSENTRFYEQNKLLFWHFALQPLGNFSHLALYKSISKNIGINKTQHILNKNLPQAHMESKLEVLVVVVGKLVKCGVHKRKKFEKSIFLLIGCLNNKQPIFGLKEF